MIPLEELRIGNFVIANDTIQQVSMIDQATGMAALKRPDDRQPYMQFSLDTIEPVILTDDILEQCGFRYHTYFKFWQLIESSDGIRSEMDVDSDYAILDFMRKPIAKNLTALHQLQNSYFILKGKELAYTVKKISAKLETA
ncbi:MAG: hypothetical protein EOO14_04850 [Chitinophagaceae bacterium]|nr:MAG: hypothetical protein EOO14_04850 [Chitinophagaceae bacterium]